MIKKYTSLEKNKKLKQIKENYSKDLFKNKLAIDRANEYGLTDIENEDLTLKGLIQKAYEWDEGHHGIEPYIYDLLKRDIENLGGKIPVDIRKLEESKHIKENDLGDENYKQMSLINFIKNPPEVLYGKIELGNYKEKFGMFKLGWNKYSNNETYHYYTLNGRKGSDGFTIKKAYELIQKNQLSTNPEYGDPNSSNWVSYKESKLSFEIEGMSRLKL
ncbi:MAG TPA: hypothetical protein VGB37_08275 [Candidatus Lokiarchaeia archaeon]